MTGKTHMLIGTCTGIITALTIGTDNAAIFCGTIASTVIGSLIPDIDNPKSTFGSKTFFTSNIINKMFGHRGITHAPIILLIFSVGLLFVLNSFHMESYIPILYGYTIGYISHLLLDALTKAGIPLFYPISKKRFHLLNIKSGGIAERLIVVGIILLLITVIFFAILHFGNTTAHFIKSGLFLF